MQATKFWKKNNQQLSKLEESAAQIIIDLENSSSELKQELSKFYLDSVKEIEITLKDKKQKSIILILVPYFSKSILNAHAKRLIAEFEKKLKTTVMFMPKRTILSKWIKANKSQKRPHNRTLTAVHDAILEDLILPCQIIGRRTRCKIDGQKFLKIELDEADKALIEDKLDCVTSIYKKLTHREIQFEFKEEKPFYSHHQ